MELNTSGVIPDDTPIWRYMDLTKFVWTLDTGCLRFAKLVSCEDPYEGLCKAVRREVPPDDRGPKLIRHEDRHGTRMQSLAEMGAWISHLSADSYEAAPERLFVNSWCLGDESMAMWEIYGSRAGGVAIKSSVGQYRQSASFGVPEWHYTFRRVEYHQDLTSSSETRLDLSQGPIPVPGPGLCEKILGVAFHKRACYEHERESRAALYQDPRPEAGIGIEFDLDKLIGAVYVGPRSEPFFLDVVESIMNKFGLSKPLDRSPLLYPPQKVNSASAG